VEPETVPARIAVTNCAAYSFGESHDNEDAMKRLLSLTLYFAVLSWLAPLAAAADPPAVIAELGKPNAAAADETQFIRVRRDDERRPLAMETAVVHYTAPKRPGVQVDLVGAVHVGDKAYYDELNKLFEKYDVVLYELVAPEGTRIPKGGRKGPSTHPIGAMQEGMSAVLELSHQLNCVDYTQQNFVHADMSPDDFNKAMEDRGESFMQMFLRLMGTGIAQNAAGAGNVDEAGLLMALFSKDRAIKLKAILAQQFESLDGPLAALDGPGGSAIITQRNKRCFEVLDKQLAASKKKVAIFYGAAHLPDMERRLTSDYGFQRTSQSWLKAWNLQKPASE
jgi:hypothetical protein